MEEAPKDSILVSKASSHSTDTDIPATLFNRQASTLDSNRSMVPTPDQSQRKRFCRSSSSSEGQSVPPAHSHIADDQSLPIEFHLPQPTAANIYPSTDGSPLLIHIPEQKIDARGSLTDRPASPTYDELLQIVDFDIDSESISESI